MIDTLNVDDKYSLQAAYDLYKNGDIEAREYLDFMAKFDKRRRELQEIRDKAGY